MGRPAGTVLPQEVARAQYYLASAEKLQLHNKKTRGELLEAAKVKAAWARRVVAYREASLNLAARLIQRGLVAREHEAALEAEIDTMLTQLQERDA